MVVADRHIDGLFRSHQTHQLATARHGRIEQISLEQLEVVGCHEQHNRRVFTPL